MSNWIRWTATLWAAAAMAAAQAEGPRIASPTATADELSEVLITARKRDEKLADVPLSVSVLDQQALESGAVYGLRELAARVPGLSFESGILLAIPIMRGQWQPSIAGDNVGIFIDGVYQANRAAIDAELLDVARIEVVAGPQSALFGHSTFAGAINYVSQSPTATPATGAALEGGTDRWRAIQGWLSGPLGPGWKARLALSARAADGSWTNAADGQPLGGFERRALAFTLQHADDPAARWSATLRARFGDNRNTLPPTNTIDGSEYNCGSRDRNSGLWSYYCGRAPVRMQFDLSPGVPDGSNRSAQVALHQAWRLGALQLQSDSSFYGATADLVRDFDVSSAGQLLGVCTIGINCTVVNGLPRPVSRLVRVNEIQHARPVSREWAEELRLSNATGSTFEWLLGITAFRTEDTSNQSMGVTRGDLATNEQLTALLPATPTAVGPVSQFSRALVADPALTQVDQADTRSERTTSAVFGSASWLWRPRWRLGAELRLTRERLELDSRVANFLPSFGRAIGARTFRDATPRVSVEFSPSAALRSYASVAKGSRSGGINPFPGLPDSEQTFRPEFNWTTELGLRWQGAALWRGVQLTLYYIDLRDTQILGFSNTPQVTNLITRNTAGMHNRGLEFATQLQPARWLRVEASASWVDALFRAGSEDPGALAFCGVGGGNQTSTFCTLGAPRLPAAGSPALVPWIDGNFAGRVPRLTWHTALLMQPRVPASGWRTTWRLDADYQSDKYERGIEGLYFGRRLLLDARWTLQRAPWSVELWGRNLADERYIYTMAGPQPQFYPTLPRPMHVVAGEGRRIGLTLRYSR